MLSVLSMLIIPPRLQVDPLTRIVLKEKEKQGRESFVGAMFPSKRRGSNYSSTPVGYDQAVPMSGGYDQADVKEEPHYDQANAHDEWGDDDPWSVAEEDGTGGGYLEVAGADTARFPSYDSARVVGPNPNPMYDHPKSRNSPRGRAPAVNQYSATKDLRGSQRSRANYNSATDC